MATLAGLLASFAAQDGRFRPSALVKMASDEPMAALARAGDRRFTFVTDVQHYDGVYYYAMARDPFARATAHGLIDQAPYRYGHPLHGWLAGVLSLGRASAVPGALLLLSLAGLALAGWAASRLVTSLGGNPWWGLAVAFNPGLLYATTVSTTETLGAGLVLSTLLAWRNERRTLACVLAAFCCFDKEQYVVVPLGLAVFHVAGRLRRRHPLAVGQLAGLSLGPILLGTWYAYVHATLHRWPFEYEPGNIGRPGSGWRQTMRYSRALSAGSFDQSQLGALTPPVLVALAMLLLVAGAVAVRVRTELDAPLIGLVVITACQGWLTLLYPHELLRTPSVALLLAVLTLGGRKRAA
ncbi:MAG TPA: hypothetical protein VJ831_11300 [Jatrophihabitantaceae bacterium]|nr:hypothetical protein [Jatrophihabitantaceae bacterium]